jgi:hypothetical protein
MPVGPFVIGWLIVRAIRATGTGPDISGLVGLITIRE